VLLTALLWQAQQAHCGLALKTRASGLAKNECLARRDAGARLLQIGEQSLAMGLKFKARVVLDIEEHPSGIAQRLISDEARCGCSIEWA
jgi:hypothetical protein